MQRLVDLCDPTVVFLTDVDGSLCDQMKKCKNHLFYLADNIQKSMNCKDVAIIPARTTLMRFQNKVGIFKTSLARSDFSNFSNLR